MSNSCLKKDNKSLNCDETIDCFNQSTSSPTSNKSPCLFVPYEQYFDTLKNIINSEWDSLNFYLFKWTAWNGYKHLPKKRLAQSTL